MNNSQRASSTNSWSSQSDDAAGCWNPSGGSGEFADRPVDRRRRPAL